MKMNSQDALALAQSFREAAKALGDYLYDNWNHIPPAARDRLRSMDVTLMNVATDLVTHAVGVVLDEGQTSLDQLTAASEQATQALQHIEDAKKAVSIATALIGLAAAIPAGDLGAIASSYKALVKVTT